jgi:carboxyl-terminal processing protease
LNCMAVPFSPNLLITMMPAINMASTIPLTLGDQPGIPGTTMKPGGCTMGNPTVLINGLPGVNLTCPAYGNMHNDELGATLVPSVTNVLFSYARDGAPALLDHEALDALGSTIASAPLRSRVIAGRVGYIRFGVIACDAAPRFHAALRDFDNRGVESVIIDLRSSRGGDLDAALDIAAELLPDGAELITLVDGEGDETTRHAHRAYPWKMRFTVLVNRGTASAAEVLAGVLQSHGRARIVGERTYGKGSCQRVSPSLTTGEPKTETVAECFLPGRRRVHGIGIEPDALR